MSKAEKPIILDLKQYQSSEGNKMKIEQWKQFINSLDGEKTHAVTIKRIKREYAERYERLSSTGAIRTDVLYANEAVKDLLSIIESRQIPDLKEKVKAFGRDCMDAARDSIDLPMSMESEFRALCEPEKVVCVGDECE